MTFLNTLFLFALTAAAIPVIIHLLNLHRIRTVDFSTLRFLKQVQRKQIKRLQFKQLWLLLLRVLIVLLLVLAFARPALRSLPAGGSAHQQTAAVIIVDNTASTLISDNMYHIKQRAQEILTGLADGDQLTILPLSGESEEGVRTRSLETARQTIDALAAAPWPADAGSAVQMTLELLLQSLDLNREVYICSDFCWEPAVVKAWRQLASETGARVFLVPVYPLPPENLAVVEAAAAGELPSLREPFSLDATLVNYGTTGREQVLVEVFLEDQRVAERTASIPPAGRQTLRFELPLHQPGYLAGYVEIEDADLKWDNRRYFSLFVPETYHVAVIGDSPTANRIVAAALQPDSSWAGRTRIELLTSAAVQSRALDEVDVVVLNSVPPAEAVYRRVERSRQAGAGVIYFPDCRHDPRSGSQLAARYLDLPLLTEIVSSRDFAREYIEWGEIDRQHPFLQPLFESEEPLESPRITRYCRYLPSDSVEAVIRLATGETFAALSERESASCLFFSVPLDIEAADFHRKGLFAPLMFRGMEWVAGSRRGNRQQAIAGTAPALAFPFTAGQWQLQAAEFIHFPEVLTRLNGDLLLCPANLEPGNYAVKADGRTAGLLTLNLDPREGDVSLAALMELADILGETASIIAPAEPLLPVVSDARWGRELWRYALAAALLLLVVEGISSRRK